MAQVERQAYVSPLNGEIVDAEIHRYEANNIGKKNSKSSRLPTDFGTSISIARDADDALPQYALCVDNTDYPVSLEVHKIYRVLPTQPTWAEAGYLRVIDKSGEDYLYPSRRFLRLRLPQTVRAAMKIAEASVAKAS